LPRTSWPRVQSVSQRSAGGCGQRAIDVTSLRLARRELDSRSVTAYAGSRNVPDRSDQFRGTGDGLLAPPCCPASAPSCWRTTIGGHPRCRAGGRSPKTSHSPSLRGTRHQSFSFPRVPKRALTARLRAASGTRPGHQTRQQIQFACIG
jgi:hypothetical protein